MNSPATRTKLDKALTFVNEGLQALQKIGSQKMVTSGMFTYTPNNSVRSINIHTSTDLAELIGVCSFLMEKYNAYNKAAEMLEIDRYPVFQWLGYSYEAWMSDLKLRVSIIMHDKTRRDLLEQKKVLESFLTDEDRLEQVLKKYKFDE